MYIAGVQKMRRAMAYTGASAESPRLRPRFDRREKHHANKSEDRSHAGDRVRHVRFVVVAVVRGRTAPAVLRIVSRREDHAQEVRVTGGAVARSCQQRRQPVHLLLLQRHVPLSHPPGAVPSTANQRPPGSGHAAS